MLAAEDIAEIRKRFMAVNRQRLKQVQEALTPRQEVFLELLPFLFHVNHPMLPGFVSQETPQGLAAYTPGDATIRAARRVARSFDYKRKAPRQFDIEALYLMGSAGTIAYSRHSDFDIWLCHRPDLPAEGVTQLREKAELVSRWAGELGLEVHFFVMTAQDFKAGEVTGLSQESSGTAQRHLLLDEFYRTAMLAGGRYPIWWLVPPGLDRDYESHVHKLVDQRFVKPGEVVDFGGLAHIPSNEFFGASLWQLYKSMDSPYKSILKILLLEAYAAEYPDVDLLSHRYKENIYSGRVALSDIDPYIQLFRKVEGHLTASGDRERLELARQAFFHRTSHHLRLPAGEDSAKKAFVRKACDAWGWDQERLNQLQEHHRQRLEQVLVERNLLMNALMTSYRFLSGFARERSELIAISERDMTVLGRRLFAAFERKAGKVQRVFEGFVEDLYEPHVVVAPRDTGETVSWLLYRAGPATAQGDHPAALHRAYTLVELLVWCHFNSVIQGATRLSTPAGSPVDIREMDAIRSVLRRIFPQDRFSPPSLEELSQPAVPVIACLFVNVGSEPPPDQSHWLDAFQPGRDDPLSSGPRHVNRVQYLDLVYTTSWHEVFVFRYTGDDGLRECLADLLRAHREGRRQDRTLEVAAFGFAPDRGMTSANRLQELHAHIVGHLGDAQTAGRYLLRLGHQFHELALEDGKPVARRVGDYPDLLDGLARVLPNPAPVHFDDYARADSPLPSVYGVHRQGEISFLYYAVRGQAYIYVLDEGGALFHDVQPLHQEESLLNQFNRFFEAIDYRETAGATFTGSGRPGIPVRYYRLEHHGGGFHHAPVEPPEALSARSYGELQVITEQVGEKTVLVIYYGNHEFSTLDHGKALFEQVARHILERRRHRETYPIYITDIDLSGVADTHHAHGGRRRTAHYLRYKKRIERQLNRALKALGSPSH